jgi:hypothetical protein
MATKAQIGMSVPGASSLMDQLSMADQVAGETAEQRRKRMAGMQAAKQLPVGMSSLADGYGSAMSVS